MAAKKNMGRTMRDGKKQVRKTTRLTRPPRLEGVVKNAAKPVKKPKGFHAKTPRATPKEEEPFERFE